MRKDSCIGCLFSEIDETSWMFKELPGQIEVIRCTHKNSPYFLELVFEDISCRQYINAQEYFKMKDRKENIEVLKENIRKKI